MESIFIGGFLLCISAAAWFDLKSRQVPDLLTGSLWLILFLSGEPLAAYAVAGGMFGLVFFLNSVVVAWSSRPVFSWADVLGIPPYVFAAGFIGAGPLLTAAPIFLTLFLAAIMKKEVPMFPFMAALLFLCLGAIILL